MYNGIGLNTPRGSGTNGFVQRNLATLRSRPEKVNYKTDAEIAKLDRILQRKPNKEILEHEWKRKIELECVQLQEKLEEQGLGLWNMLTVCSLLFVCGDSLTLGMHTQRGLQYLVR